MAVPTASLIILAACVVGMEQAKAAATDDLLDVVLSLKTEVAELKKRNEEQDVEIASLRTALQEQQNSGHVKDRRAAERVAFSTYLTHDQYNISPGQKIKYDGILLNDGNGYDQHLSAFKAPVKGLYLFSYSVAKYRIGEARVRLVKNGNVINCAMVHVITGVDGHQAGNVAPVELDVGDVVSVEEYFAADALIYGNSTDRWTTFSGVLLM